MTAVNNLVVPAMAEESIIEDPKKASLEELHVFAVAHGMDPMASNKLQVPDLDFLQEMAKLPINHAEIPSGTDYKAMRQWINEVFLEGPLAEVRAQCHIQRRHPVRKVDKTIVSVKCPGDSDDRFNLWIYRAVDEEVKPKDHDQPAILMFHGGGWIHGTPFGDEVMAEIFASELDAIVFGVDYRLAPENRFPAPLDDCTEALIWVAQHASDYNIDKNRIALWGCSAGGNLAAALALKCSQSRSVTSTTLPNPCMVSLVVPVTAHPAAQILFEKNRSFEKSQNEILFADDPPVPELVIREFKKLYGLYLDDETDPCNPLVSPLMAEHSSQHPPTHITIAACDNLRSQDLAYAALLRSCGVEVTEDILPGVPHGFTFPMNAKVTQRWLERQVNCFATAFQR